MLDQNFLVSIIIPIYNRSKTIAETLDSVLLQTHKDYECILVDDGSTDDSLKIIKSYLDKDSRILLFSRPPEKPKGANSCRNYGFDKSRGEFVLFLDSDDLLKEICLEKRLSVFNKNKNLDFVSSDTAYYNGNNYSKTAICFFPEATNTKEYLHHFLKYKIPWPIMGVLWKRDTIKDIEFNESLQRLQDVDFHIRILLQDNLKGFRLNVIDNYYRSEKGKSNSQKHIKIVVQSASKIIKEYLIFNLLNKEQLKSFRQFILFFSFNYFYPNQSKFKKEVSEVEGAIKNTRLFTKNEIRLLKFYKFLEYSNLNKINGLGIYKLTKQIKKVLKYE